MTSYECPVVSVVIAAYNGAHIIGDQLDALSAQTDAPPFEVVVVDNNSSDDLAAACAPYTGRLDMRIIKAADHQGQGYARNVGALAARGDYLCLCDQDDVVSSTWLAALVGVVEPGGVLATGPMDMLKLNPPGTDLIGRNVGAQEPYPVHDYLPFVFGSNIGIRRGDYLRIGGMDNAFQGGSEDVDFAWRAQEAGLRIVLAPDAVVHYRLRHTPRAVFRQQIGYGHTQVLMWRRSVDAGRPVRGMSMRWTVQKVAGLPAGWWRARRDPQKRIEFAQDAGRKIGNLQGQVRYRLLKKVPSPFTLHEMAPKQRMNVDTPAP